MVQKEKIIWAAGLLDGEGSFQVKRHIRPHRGEQKVYYQLWITCGMAVREDGKNTEAVNILKELFGGNVWINQDRVGNRKDAIIWTVVSNDALKMLETIYPYLVVKTKHADLLIKFQKNMQRLRNQKRDEEEMAKRENIFWELRKLNSKGKTRLQRLSEGTPKGEAIV